MVIDTGNYYTNAADYLSSIGISQIDYLILTNYSTKNICGAEAVLSRFDVNTVIMPDMDASQMTAATRKTVNTIKQAQTDFILVNESEIGRRFEFGEAVFELLTPLVIKYEDEYDCYSIAVKLDYKAVSFLFMSDVTPENTQALLDSDADLTADVICVSQNGRSAYTSEELLDRVLPEYAVINIPEPRYEEHLELAERLKIRGIGIVYTDEANHQRFISDGEKVEYIQQ